MQTKVIEISVTGETGSGKSEVLEVIANALRAHYPSGDCVKVAGEVCTGAIDEAKTTGQSAKGKDTILVLTECNVPLMSRLELHDPHRDPVEVQGTSADGRELGDRL
jgi:nucleoside-triphosphatase THEP1